MARLALEPHWRVSFANDFSHKKARAYAAAFGPDGLVEGDVWRLTTADLPGRAALAWASFPCQDLSLAGARAGLSAPRSGAFWGFWRLIEDLAAEGRAPGALALENVRGFLTANGGRDFADVAAALARARYWFGAVEVDASWFTPQSRPRVFLIASRRPIPSALRDEHACHPAHSAGVIAAHRGLPEKIAQHWVWWRLPAAPLRNLNLADIVEPNVPADEDLGRKLVALMSTRQLALLEAARPALGRAYGAGFRRVRVEAGARVQRLEARFDGLAGCLRTPAGGSSRQFLLQLSPKGPPAARLMTPRECARLMGLPDDFPLPARTSDALALLGDGVCVPAVRWLSDHLLRPLAQTTAPAL